GGGAPPPAPPPGRGRRAHPPQDGLRLPRSSPLAGDGGAFLGAHACNSILRPRANSGPAGWLKEGVVMQAVVLGAFGSPDNLRAETVATPSPGPGEVLLRVRACGVCFHDVINRRGNLPRTRVPAILGHEAAGEVVAVGDGVSGWSVGDCAAAPQRLSCGLRAAWRARRPSPFHGAPR